MKVTMETVLAAAERVVRARDELRAAEEAFAALADMDSKTTRRVTRGARPAVAERAASAPVSSEPVTHRVRRFLSRGGRHSFADVMKAVQPAAATAVRSALNLDRDKGTVDFDGETWGVVAPKAPKQKPPVAGSKKEPATGG